MDLFLAICQGLGLAIAIGIGGAVAALFASLMGSLEAGFEPDGTDFEFITATWFLITLLAIVVLAVVARGRDAARIPVLLLLSAAGAIAFAASLAEEGETAWPGLVLGAIATFAAAVIALDVLEGAIARAGSQGDAQKAADAANTLQIGFVFGGMLIAALALFVPPASLVAAAALLVLALARRRRAGEKYEGLRSLR